MSESAYLSIPARAIFNGKSVIVEGVGAKIDGQRQDDATDQEVTSDGVLYYQGLPEGNFSMSFSSSSSTTTTNYEIEIEFKEDGADPDSLPVAKFVGVLTSPQNGSGVGFLELFDIYQQVYLLSLVSNMIMEEKKAVGDLQSLANARIVKAVGRVGWDVVWGPVVWKNDPNNQWTGPDHVWFVAKKKKLYGSPVYVISIAATATIYNHVVNNAGFVQVVDFTTWATDTPPSPTSTAVDSGTYVALGTALGVHTLRSYPAPPGAAAGARETLPSFLKNTERRGSGTQFIFTGYSLGGALSPTLALALKKMGADVFNNLDKVMTYPIAGPSPGNAQFAKLFAQEFPKISSGSEHPYQVWNTNIANSLDTVIHGWSTDSRQSQNLDKIPNIYGNYPALPEVEEAVKLAKDAAYKSGIVYTPLQSTLIVTAAVTPPKNVEEFHAIVRTQHISAYNAFFGIKISVLLWLLKLLGGPSPGVAEIYLEEEDIFPDGVQVLDIWFKQLAE